MSVVWRWAAVAWLSVLCRAVGCRGVWIGVLLVLGVMGFDGRVGCCSGCVGSGSEQWRLLPRHRSEHDRDGNRVSGRASLSTHGQTRVGACDVLAL